MTRRSRVESSLLIMLVHMCVVPVVNFTAGEAIRAKREFEQEMVSMGVVTLHYHTDNGVFTSAEFQDELAKLNQGLSLSGVGAHHQNAVAERAIGTVASLARTMMLHSKMRWPKRVSTKLWPMTMKHAEFIVNHVPNLNNVCPLDVVLKTVVPRHLLEGLYIL
jgi:transposase InsO family protein